MCVTILILIISIFLSIKEYNNYINYKNKKIDNINNIDLSKIENEIEDANKVLEEKKNKNKEKAEVLELWEKELKKVQSYLQ